MLAQKVSNEDTKEDPKQQEVENEDVPEVFPEEVQKFWESPEAFEPKTFAENFTNPRKFVDIGWAIAFIINFIITVVLFLASQPWKTENFDTEEGSLKAKDVFFTGVISIGVAFGYCVLMLALMWLIPGPYVKLSILFVFLESCATIIPVCVVFSIWSIFAAIIPVAGIIITFFKICRKANFSASLMKASVFILRKYPSIFFFNLAMLVVQLVLSYIFNTGAIVAWSLSIHPAIYIYVVVSYYWITSTITYISYQTCAGVAAAWYFLNDTEYMPEHPIIFSLKNAITKSLGPCCLAGFMEAISNAFSFIEEQGVVGGCLYCCFKCCCNCFLCVVKWFVGLVSRYSLIYTAMFGVKASDGVKRWKMMKKKKIIKQVLNSSIIGSTFDFYSSAATSVGYSIGGIIGSLVYGKGSTELVFLCATCALFAFNGNILASKPIEVLSDTLFIGFAEKPMRLMSGAAEVYDLLDKKSQEQLESDIKDEMKKQDPNPGCGLCCC